MGIGIFVGSLRRESFSKKVALALKDMLSFDAKLVDISTLPMYNQDFDDDGTPPQEWADFREEVKTLSAVLFVTPEYNRSLPAVLKNALDVGSRPYGQSVWQGKPGGVIGVSPGKLGGFGASQVLRQSVVFLNIPMMQMPEAYIGEVENILGKNGEITDENARKFLEEYADAFLKWVLKQTTDLL
jgi:chromate reductase